MTSDKTISIAIIDDHNLFRLGMMSLLSESTEIQIVFDASNGKDMMEKIVRHPLPEVILMDVSMPIMDGFESTSWIKENYPQIKILALSMFEEDKPIIKMLKKGAGGYLLKESKTSDVIAAIKAINQHGYYLNDLVSGKLLRNIQDHQPAQNVETALSTNETKFLQLCCSEFTYKEIADQMNLSPHTIDNYRQDLFQRFEIKSRTGLVLFALKHELVVL